MSADVQTDPARYIPMQTTDYLIVAFLAGSIVAVLAVTLYTQYASNKEDLEDELQDNFPIPKNEYSDYQYQRSVKETKIDSTCIEMSENGK